MAGTARNANDAASEEGVVAGRARRRRWIWKRKRTAALAKFGASTIGCPTVLSGRGGRSGMARAAGSRDRLGERHVGTLGAGDGAGAGGAAGRARDYGFGGGVRDAVATKRGPLDGSDLGRRDVRRG